MGRVFGARFSQPAQRAVCLLPRPQPSPHAARLAPEKVAEAHRGTTAGLHATRFTGAGGVGWGIPSLPMGESARHVPPGGAQRPQ